MNSMKDIRIEKVTINIGAGKDQAKLDKGVILLNYISGSKPIKTVTKKRIQAPCMQKLLQGNSNTDRIQEIQLIKMAVNDNLANALSLMLNNEKIGRTDCEVRPSFRLLREVLNILKQNGYVESFEEVE